MYLGKKPHVWDNMRWDWISNIGRPSIYKFDLLRILPFEKVGEVKQNTQKALHSGATLGDGRHLGATRKWWQVVWKPMLPWKRSSPENTAVYSKVDSATLWALCYPFLFKGCLQYPCISVICSGVQNGIPMDTGTLLYSCSIGRERNCR